MPGEVAVSGVESGVAREAMRKAMLHLIPLLGVGYCIAYMDRVNISFAALEMNRDLHFSATAYGLGAGLFFVSYALCEIPSNLLMLRFGARRWLARIMITWGVLAIGMMLVRTPLEFYAMRFLLGIAEAGFFPGIIFYLTQWFPQAMRARAISRFYIALPLSSVLMGSIAGALLGLRGRLGLTGWQWLFLVEGLPAVVMGGVYLLFLPDGPAKARWLNAEERQWLLGQLEEEKDAVVGKDAAHGGHTLAALRDPRVWWMGLFFLFMLCTLYAYTFSAPLIVQKVTGFDATRTGYVVAGMGLLGALCMVLNGRHSDRHRERFWHVVVPCLVMGTGYLVSGAVRSAPVVVVALAAAVMAFNAMQGPVWAFASSFSADEGAAAGIATMNMIGMVGGLLGPYWIGWMRDLTGSYERGLMGMAVPSLLCVGLFTLLRRLRGTPSEQRS